MVQDNLGAAAMNRTTELLRNLGQEPEELEWATAKGPKRDKSHESRSGSSTAKEAQKPLALLGRYCTEGKISHGHIDDRQNLKRFTNQLLRCFCICRIHHAGPRTMLTLHALLTVVCNMHRYPMMPEGPSSAVICPDGWENLFKACAECSICASPIPSSAGHCESPPEVRVFPCRCLSYMKNLHPDVQCQALTEYANRRSKDTLNNPPAYFMSLLQVSLCSLLAKPHDLTCMHQHLVYRATALQPASKHAP